MNYRGHAAPVTSIAFSPDARLLLTGSLDATASMLELSTGRQLLRFVGHTGGIIGVAFAPDGRTVLTRSSDGTVRIWDAANGTVLSTVSIGS